VRVATVLHPLNGARFSDNTSWQKVANGSAV